MGGSPPEAEPYSILYGLRTTPSSYRGETLCFVSPTPAPPSHTCTLDRSAAHRRLATPDACYFRHATNRNEHCSSRRGSQPTAAPLGSSSRSLSAQGEHPLSLRLPRGTNTLIGARHSRREIPRVIREDRGWSQEWLLPELREELRVGRGRSTWCQDRSRRRASSRLWRCTRGRYRSRRLGGRRRRTWCPSRRSVVPRRGPRRASVHTAGTRGGGLGGEWEGAWAGSAVNE